VKTLFHFVTLFPETVHAWMGASILGRALRKGVFDYRVHQLRDYSLEKHRTVDDVAYGGGGGMVLKAEPLVHAVESIRSQIGEATSQVVYFTPKGIPFNQGWLESTLQTDPQTYHWILVCGHYEGVDQRFLDGWVDLEISLGDFVLTGGEIPALAFADAYCRQLGGTLSQEHAPKTESFALKDTDGRRLLEYPHYTRPADFRGRKVPQKLLSGDHAAVERWRME